MYRLKAFHSLLNKVISRIGLNETYEVTDLCVGGDVAQRYDTDIGMLQVPPAIIPEIPGDINDCTKLDANSLGYKPEDIALRLRKLTNMPEEHAAWKAFDDRDSQQPSTERLGLAQPADGRDTCKFTHLGQDRITTDARINTKTTQFGPSPAAIHGAAGFFSNSNLSPNDTIINGDFNTTGPDTSSNSDSGIYGSFTREYTEIGTSFCELDQQTDYCYKGRVDDELLHRSAVVGKEWWQCKPCSIGMGVGVYWTYPSISVMVSPGSESASPKSKANGQYSLAKPPMLLNAIF